MPGAHLLARRETVTPLDLAEEPLVAVTRRFSFRARLELAFAERGLSLRIALEVGTHEFVVEMVRAGAGLAVVNPFPLSDRLGPDLVLRPCEPAIRHETVFLLPSTREVGAAARRFATFVRAERRVLESLDLRGSGHATEARRNPTGASP